MPLVSLSGALAAVTVAALWASLKLVKWSLNAEAPELRHPVQTEDGGVVQPTLGELIEVYKLGVLGILALELWPGLASWAYDAWYWILGVIP